MNRSFSPSSVRSIRPNQPLRKPSTLPVGVPALTPPSRRLTSPGTVPVPHVASLGALNALDKRVKSPFLGTAPPDTYFCNFCGQQGNFRCKGCKKTPYCSVACQSKDWKVHKDMCKSSDGDTVKEKSKESCASPVLGDRASLLESKHSDGPCQQRVYLKDLYLTKIIKGTDVQASLLEFYSPSRFFIFVQSPEVREALQNISMELQKTYGSCPSTMVYTPCQGEVCAVQFSCDMNWYRGLVQTLAPDHKTAKVLYIDFGNEEDVPIQRIKPLNANIQLFCPCAMECHIAGVVPVNSSWSGECCLAVRQMLAGKTVTVKLIETLESGHVHAVDIMLSLGNRLSTFLIEHGYAMKEMAAVTPSEQEISGMLCASLEIFKRFSGGKDDNIRAEAPKAQSQAVGDSFSVVVTHFQSPTKIIVQKVENAGMIQEMQLKLKEHCCKSPAPLNFRPAPSTACCAQFSEDKQWYRAKILAYSSEERVCVGYIDFGNSEEVEIRHLRPITASLSALPMQAIPCGLAGVQPAEEDWSEECLLALKRRICNRVLRVDIQGAHKGNALMTMIDESSDPQDNIAELLISAGYALPATITNDQQAEQKPAAAAEPHVSNMPREPLLWSSAELPRDGQTVMLLSSVVVNPSEFYCHINNPADNRQLVQLGAELKQLCEDVAPFTPKVGEPCCAKFPGDGAWHRAMVQQLLQDSVSVYFVDYGYSIQVKNSCVRAIEPKLLVLPFQAIRCWLAGVEPLGLEWSSEATLWFQSLVDGHQLSARVLALTEQGYGVALESRGLDVADALISQQLARGSGQTERLPDLTAKEARTSKSTVAKNQESVKEMEDSQKQLQASNQTAASSQDEPSEELSATVKSEAESFPLDWKTVELPVNEMFQPYFAAITSPSLFYLVGSNQVEPNKLREVMVELAAYCSTKQASVAASRPAPGAVCCAQFSADNNWYRAVVLEVAENEITVIYADYGNIEQVPCSRILAIPVHLLQLPFQIVRCALIGREHFPTVWPAEVQQMFRDLLSQGVLATVQSFDGSVNLLSLTLTTEGGRSDVTALILKALQAQVKTPPSPATPVLCDRTTAAPNCPQSTRIPETHKSLDDPPATTPDSPKTLPHTTSAERVDENEVQMRSPCRIDTKNNDLQNPSCCCLSLKMKIDHLEQLMQLQISLIKQLTGQT
ncbi:tudor domain-containing protein 1 [Thalassophryne amazonica]|uniref:tudor domain-containing protein 1 n=1 Tax=Thalassophryne amazonica TaxID=390379 RepID=UPI00147216A7|nr:tudor domain-containing protein 1 [Thalassophryne amazonica]